VHPVWNFQFALSLSRTAPPTNDDILFLTVFKGQGLQAAFSVFGTTQLHITELTSRSLAS
jgi:hypothetical protein